MALTPGTRLGPYVITAPLGAGGMGEVYKATDTRLDRTAYRLDFVPSADGKRILMSTPINAGEPPAITVVLNWPVLLNR